MTDLLHQARRRAEDHPYELRKGTKGELVVWENLGQGAWSVCARFAKREDAEDFLFIKARPVLGEF